MNPQISQAKLFIGWDVGGWDCDRNPRSRDALVVLDAGRHLLGHPWRGNLRQTINQASSAPDFIARLLRLCEVDCIGEARALISIDAPLAFPESLVALMAGAPTPVGIDRNDFNPYLFRATERFLMSRGIRPLSAVKDMIGSQATKAQHVVGRFASSLLETGIWTDGAYLGVTEAYPSAAHRSESFLLLRREFTFAQTDQDEMVWLPEFEHADEVDALSCALIAWMICHMPEALASPTSDIPAIEGWIWVPQDALGVHRDLIVD